MREINLWKDAEKKIVDPLLFSQTAETMAKELGGDFRVNKGTQLRRFFDEVVRFNDAAKNKSIDIEQLLPGLHLIIARAAYAQGRNLVSADFVSFIRSGIEQIQRKEDLRVFTNFFEALMAFYKLYNSK
ncbi:type III-A CRISPR-associated protein Csm2 [Desulforhopalus vacuolatus]|uniref:type III-A CRISPR-associated protein Csm2 n=1 Tax=Desulforhopalus vacuolatus TaxID=40414 RepID=UPI0019639C2B|nr:type III-A CRISPR-associated protein Csm2 [Desulforhopalus vacuolatus]MBM9520569.1 type III-A CRISPR-associated protein Csm2 [Desulforhopalus vacuolatus]